MNNVAELISLGLTVPTVILSAYVVVLFFPIAVYAMAERNKKQAEWLILGITIGFMGSIVDNVYWAVAWSASYLDLDCKDFLFTHGVYSNIPFRQLAGVMAAILHCMADTSSAAVVKLKRFKNLKAVLIASVILACVFIGVLFVFKHYLLGG